MRNTLLHPLFQVLICFSIFQSSVNLKSFALGGIKSVQKLIITNIQNTEKLSKLGEFTNLEVLEIHCLPKLDRIPDGIGNLRRLKILNMDQGNGCAMNPQLPESIGNLSELKELNLYGAQDISDVLPVGSSRAVLTRTRRSLPKRLINLKQLEKLNLGRNRYGTIPPIVFSITNVKELNLSFNNLSDLPSELLNLPYLSKIILDGNYKITCSTIKMAELTKRFRGVYLDFENEYTCPSYPKSSTTNPKPGELPRITYQEPLLNEGSRVGTNGIGPVYVGMTVNQGNRMKQKCQNVHRHI